MRNYCMASEGEHTSGRDTGGKLPNPAICRARPAKLPDMAYCLVRDPTECEHVRYFNEVAYCTHPQREAIIAKTVTQEERRAADA